MMTSVSRVKVCTAWKIQFVCLQILSQFRYLGKYGRLLSISIVPGKTSETAFVTFASEESATAAIQVCEPLFSERACRIVLEYSFHASTSQQLT